jgi:hypothetical protein
VLSSFLIGYSTSSLEHKCILEQALEILISVILNTKQRQVRFNSGLIGLRDTEEGLFDIIKIDISILRY